jgi:hypothetical protein
MERGAIRSARKVRFSASLDPGMHRPDASTFYFHERMR